MSEPRKLCDDEQPDVSFGALLREMLDRLDRIEDALAKAPKDTGEAVGEAINRGTRGGRR